MRRFTSIYPLLLVFLVAPSALPSPAVQATDRITVAGQFLREFFPQLAGRTADIEYTARQSLHASNERLSVGFKVIDLCLRAPGQNAPVGNQQHPCFELDTRYQSPLLGEFGFQELQGKMVLTEGVVKGTTVNSHQPGAHPQTCPLGAVSSNDEVVRKLRLKSLSGFLGDTARVEDTEKAADNTTWTVHIVVGTTNPTRYFFLLDECGGIFHFGKI